MTTSIPIAVRHVIDEYRRFLRTSFRFRDEHLRGQFEKHIEEAGVIIRGPFVTLSKDFERGETLEALVKSGGVDPELLKFRWAFGKEPLYKHQELAYKAGKAARPFIVTTGTGSGKTEAFLLPIFDGVLRRKRQGIKGVQAILLYPMNALANDQLKRLREMIRESGVSISYGLYTGESDKVVQGIEGDPAPTERLTHDAIRRDPPDILLTNYKQLEFLLIRTEDRKLFTPSLRYLVLDEIHTYRGALATEMACLIRRLKSHAELKAGDLVGIGTSATVASGAGGAGAMAKFASGLFGEPFNEKDIIAESYAPPSQPKPAWAPPAPNLSEADLEGTEGLAEKLAGKATSADELLEGNQLVRAIEEALAKPSSLVEAVKIVRDRFPDRAKLPEVSVRREIEAYLILGSVESEGTIPKLRPKLHTFFHGVYDVWLCLNPECRKLVPQGGGQCPSCESAARPAAVCRTCGQDFVKVRFDDGGATEGTGDFYSDETVGFLTPKLHGLPEDEEEEANGKKSKSAADILEPIQLCIKCGRILEMGAACPTCEVGPVPYLLYRWNKKSPPKRGILHTCPCCGDTYTQGDIVTPLRSGTASSVAVLMERHLDLLEKEDRKLLVFADNRQDAAHQAGYTEDKHRTFALRHVIARKIQEAGSKGVSLIQLPPILFEEYKKLGLIQGKQTLHERDTWTQVLLYEAATELTRLSRLRMSLENLGLVAVEYEFLEDLGKDAGFKDAVKDAGIDVEIGLKVVRAGLDVMRRERAVGIEAFQEYIDPSRNHRYLEWETNYNVRFPEWGASPHGFALNRPDPIVKSKSRTIMGFYQENQKVGMLTATQKVVSRVLGGDRARSEAFLKRLVPIMVAGELLVEVPHFPVPKKDRTPGLRVLQINPKIVRLVKPDKSYRCGSCQTWRPYDFPICPTPKCSRGKLAPKPIDLDNYYVQLYTQVPPGRLRVEEHSAQIADDERARRETEFKKGFLNALVSTPTLELGVDIGQLRTVILRNAPPSPANYVQRVGRAGRRLRIGFVSTFCGGGSHDRHAFENPEWLVAGNFVPRRLRLDNPRIVHRHLRSFVLELLDAQVPNRMGDLLDDLRTPTRWLPEKIEALLEEARSKKSKIVAHMESLFEADRKAQLVARYGRKECEKVLEEFKVLLERVIELWWKRVYQLDQEYKKYSKIGAPSADEKKARARRRAYLEITQDPDRSYTLSYLGTQGFLPAYQFPLDTFTLDPGVADTPTLYRASGIAIEEFAPGNYVYANGRKLKSIRVLFAGAPISGAPVGRSGAEASGRLKAFSFCKKCDEASEDSKNTCPRCGSEMDSPTDCVFADAFEAEENLKIDSSEESRRRQYFVRRESLLPGGNGAVLYPYPLAPLELRRLGRILITNWGRADSKKEEGRKFWLCQDCGRHQPFDPENPAHLALLQKWGDDHRRLCSGKTEKLILGYEFQTDCLVLSVPGAKDSGDKSMSPTLVTLAEALLAGARAVLEVESSEMSAFPRSSKEEDETGEIVFYEMVPGGAGYLEELAKRLPDAAKAAKKILFGHDCRQACYLCLKHYYNQRRHRDLDKDLIRDHLNAIESLDGVEAVAGSAVEKLRKELRERRDDLAKSGKLPGVGGPQSPIESKLLDALRRIEGLPAPETQHSFAVNGRVLTIADFAFPDAKIAIYCDGFAFHGNVETLELDAKKRNRLQLMGWLVLTFWGRTITRNPDECAYEIARLYHERLKSTGEQNPEKRAVEHIRAQLGDRPWTDLTKAVIEILSHEREITLPKLVEQAQSQGLDWEQMHVVLEQLTFNRAPLLERVFLFMDAESTLEVKLEEVGERLRAALKGNISAVREWEEWARNVRVVWRRPNKSLRGPNRG